jgi:hypothetical protein
LGEWLTERGYTLKETQGVYQRFNKPLVLHWVEGFRFKVAFAWGNEPGLQWYMGDTPEDEHLPRGWRYVFDLFDGYQLIVSMREAEYWHPDVSVLGGLV